LRFSAAVRLVFNVYILPPRAAGDVRGQEVRRSATAVGRHFAATEQPLRVFSHTLMEPATSFYLERAYGGIVYRQFEDFDARSFYVANPWQYPRLVKANGRIDTLYMRHQPDLPYYPIFPLRDPAIANPDEYPDELLDGMGTGWMIHLPEQ